MSTTSGDWGHEAKDFCWSYLHARLNLDCPVNHQIRLRSALSDFRGAMFYYDIMRSSADS